MSQLKQNPLTRHIPVQVTTIDDNPQYALAGGAYSFFSKSGGSEELAAGLARLIEFAVLAANDFWSWKTARLNRQP